MSDETEAPPEDETPASPLPPVMKPDQTADVVPPAKTVGGAHDIENHPAIAGGTIRNVGDNVLARDPNAPAFNRPPLEDPGASSAPADRSTTTSAPAKKSSRGKSKGDGAGPES